MPNLLNSLLFYCTSLWCTSHLQIISNQIYIFLFTCNLRLFVLFFLYNFLVYICFCFLNLNLYSSKMSYVSSSFAEHEWSLKGIRRTSNFIHNKFILFLILVTEKRKSKTGGSHEAVEHWGLELLFLSPDGPFYF